MLPPAFALAVDGAFAGDGNILSIGGAYQRLRRGKTELDFCGIVGVIGRAEQRGAFVELEGDVAFEHDGRAEIGARGEANGAAALGRAGVDGGLNGGGVLGGSVALGAEVAGIAGSGGVERGGGCGDEGQGEKGSEDSVGEPGSFSNHRTASHG
jgi:hypothetical protein